MDNQDILKSIQPYVMGWIDQAVRWQDYTATISGSTGTIGLFAADNVTARYCTVGKLCHTIVVARITNKGSWGGDLQVAVPVTPVNSYYSIGGGEVMADGGITTKGKLILLNDGYFRFSKTIRVASLQWTDLAVNDNIFIDRYFEIA